MQQSAPLANSTSKDEEISRKRKRTDSNNLIRVRILISWRKSLTYGQDNGIHLHIHGKNAVINICIHQDPKRRKAAVGESVESIE
jgi:hypothetical protein